MRRVLTADCGERETVPVAGAVISIVENGLKNPGCSRCHFKISCRFSKLVYFMPSESICKIPGLSIGPIG